MRTCFSSFDEVPSCLYPQITLPGNAVVQVGRSGHQDEQREVMSLAQSGDQPGTSLPDLSIR